MDPLFERRELLRNVHVESRFLQRNIHASLVAQLRMKYEGTCVAEGFIQRDSITVIEHSLGRTNLIKGGLDYTVRFQADICFPHPGQVFRVPVSLRSKIGIHAVLEPLDVLLPRDLHIGSEEFASLDAGQEVEFEVVGARFQQGDETIVVLGKMRNVIQPAPLELPGASDEVTIPMIAAPVKGSDASAEKVVTVDASTTKTSEAPRKRRIQLKPASTTNEPPA